MNKWILPIASIILSLTAIFIACFRSEPISLEWAAIFIGVLGALVTFLVAWQIFSAITYRQELKDTLKSYDELKNSCQETYDNLYKDVKDAFTDIIPKFEEKINCAISSITRVIVTRQNHGEKAALRECIDILKATEDSKGFIYKEIGVATWGIVSDIVSLKYRFNDTTQLDRCVSEIPYEDICYLNTIDFKYIELSDVDIFTFQCWIRFILSQYPPLPDPVVD